MKLILKVIGYAAALALLVVLLTVGAFFTTVILGLGLRPVADSFEMNGIRLVKDKIRLTAYGTIGIVPVGEREVALIDTGYDKSGKAILSELSRLQLDPDAVVAILITHAHLDHIAGIPLFPKAQVMALEPDVGPIEGLTRFRGGVNALGSRAPNRPVGVKVHRILHDGENLSIGRTMIRVYAVPGHSPGSAAYLVNGILFLGDTADAKVDGRLQESHWITSEDQAQDRRSLIRLAHRLMDDGTDVKAIAFSHSGALANGLTPLTAFAQQNQ